MQWMTDHGLVGRRLMTTDSWAGYLILRYWPQQRVFMDDRYDMYPRPVIDDYIKFSDADKTWREILDRNRVDVVLWRVNQPIVRLMEADPGWATAHTDKRAVVLVRR
jgi:hypothetical protein